MADRLFELPLPGGWDATPSGFATANHEAAHGAVAHWYGLELLEVRVDKPVTPEAGTLGLCAYAPPSGGTWDDYRAQAHVALAGPLSEGRRVPWPASRDDEDGDTASAARFAFILGWGEADWTRAHVTVAGLLALPTVRRWVKALSGALLDLGALPGEQATRLLETGALAGDREPAG